MSEQLLRLNWHYRSILSFKRLVYSAVFVRKVVSVMGKVLLPMAQGRPVVVVPLADVASVRWTICVPFFGREGSANTLYEIRLSTLIDGLGVMSTYEDYCGHDYFVSRHFESIHVWPDARTYSARYIHDIGLFVVEQAKLVYTRKMAPPVSAEEFYKRFDLYMCKKKLEEALR